MADRRFKRTIDTDTGLGTITHLESAQSAAMDFQALVGADVYAQMSKVARHLFVAGGMKQCSDDDIGAIMGKYDNLLEGKLTTRGGDGSGARVTDGVTAIHAVYLANTPDGQTAPTVESIAESVLVWKETAVSDEVEIANPGKFASQLDWVLADVEVVAAKRRITEERAKEKRILAAKAAKAAKADGRIGLPQLPLISA